MSRPQVGILPVIRCICYGLILASGLFFSNQFNFFEPVNFFKPVYLVKNRGRLPNAWLILYKK